METTSQRQELSLDKVSSDFSTPLFDASDSLTLDSVLSVGIDEDCVVAGVLPEEKADHIRKLQATKSFTPKSGSNGHRFVLFAGDGLNDSVALAAADVGLVPHQSFDTP